MVFRGTSRRPCCTQGGTALYKTVALYHCASEKHTHTIISTSLISQSCSGGGRLADNVSGNCFLSHLEHFHEILVRELAGLLLQPLAAFGGVPKLALDLLFSSLHSCLLLLKSFDGFLQRLLGELRIQSSTTVARLVCIRQCPRTLFRHSDGGSGSSIRCTCGSSSGAARHGLFAAGRDAAAQEEGPWGGAFRNATGSSAE